ncbi:hypothetical protein [Spirulina subsalsa]|uniref:hypothetical protein n=1 Tax=Spirulina subsalsa TaxID=54311 RepID=UPI00192B2E87|nr:hypothetical protein [Spirulina subsalsa]
MMIKLSLSPIALITTGLLGTAALSMATFGNFPAAHANNHTFTGVVERVWEDGFRLRVGNRRITTDTWDVCGDFTPDHVSVGDRLTVVGEFEGGQFDVFRITNTAGERVCS